MNLEKIYSQLFGANCLEIQKIKKIKTIDPDGEVCICKKTPTFWPFFPAKFKRFCNKFFLTLIKLNFLCWIQIFFQIGIIMSGSIDFFIVRNHIIDFLRNLKNPPWKNFKKNLKSPLFERSTRWDEERIRSSVSVWISRTLFLKVFFYKIHFINL